MKVKVLKIINGFCEICNQKVAPWHVVGDNNKYFKSFAYTVALFYSVVPCRGSEPGTGEPGTAANWLLRRRHPSCPHSDSCLVNTAKGAIPLAL